MFPYLNDDKNTQDPNVKDCRPANPNDVINMLYEQQQQAASSSGLLNSMAAMTSAKWFSPDMFRAGSSILVVTSMLKTCRAGMPPAPGTSFHPPTSMGWGEDQLRVQEHGRLAHVLSGLLRVTPQGT
eukprot:758699-Hanusia_phi.AAC.6